MARQNGVYWVYRAKRKKGRIQDNQAGSSDLNLILDDAVKMHTTWHYYLDSCFLLFPTH